MPNITEQRRFKRKLLRKIDQRSMSGDGTIARNLLEAEIWRYLNSHAVQCATLHSIWQKKNGAAEANRRWQDAQAYPVVPRDVRRHRHGVVYFFNKPRTTSGHRKICSFSDVDLMWHVMAKELIVAQHRPKLHIGDWKGRGRHAQIENLISSISSAGQHVVVADIRRCFANVYIDEIYELSLLPEPLIRRVIDYRHHRFGRREKRRVPGYMHMLAADDLKTPPSGLMEGSPASNAIFSVLMNDLADHFGEGILVFTYCDNILIVTPSMMQAQQAQQTLVRYFTGHRAGDFRIEPTIHAVTDYFDHLGYQIHFDVDRKCLVSLSPANEIKFRGKISNVETSSLDISDWLNRSFPLCSDASFEQYAIEIAERRDYLAEVRVVADVS